MDIKKPDISRELARLIKEVPADQRSEFMALARLAPDMECFRTLAYV
tara:strand:- start:563 stop:703 length:141 start_codon:yes stop_codon:yes gene_type:complete